MDPIYAHDPRAKSSYLKLHYVDASPERKFATELLLEHHRTMPMAEFRLSTGIGFIDNTIDKLAGVLGLGTLLGGFFAVIPGAEEFFDKLGDKLKNALDTAVDDLKQAFSNPKDFAKFALTGGTNLLTKWSAKLAAEALKPVFEVLGFEDKTIVSSNFSVSPFWSDDKVFNTEDDWVLKHGLTDHDYVQGVKDIVMHGLTPTIQSADLVFNKTNSPKFIVNHSVKSVHLDLQHFWNENKTKLSLPNVTSANFKEYLEPYNISRGLVGANIQAMYYIYKQPAYNLLNHTYFGSEIISVVGEDRLPRSVFITVHTRDGKNRTYTIPRSTDEKMYGYIRFRDRSPIPLVLRNHSFLLFADSHPSDAKLDGTNVSTHFDFAEIAIVRENKIWLSDAELDDRKYPDVYSKFNLDLKELQAEDRKNPEVDQLQTKAYGFMVPLYEIKTVEEVDDGDGDPNTDTHIDHPTKAYGPYEYAYRFFSDIAQYLVDKDVSDNNHGLGPVLGLIVQIIYDPGKAPTTHGHGGIPSSQSVSTGLYFQPLNSNRAAIFQLSGVTTANCNGQDIVDTFLAGTPSAGWDKPFAPPTTKGTFSFIYTGTELKYDKEWLRNALDAIASVKKEKITYFDTGHDTPDPNRPTHSYTTTSTVEGVRNNVRLLDVMTPLSPKSFNIVQGNFNQIHLFGSIGQRMRYAPSKSDFASLRVNGTNLIFEKAVGRNLISTITIFDYGQMHGIKIRGTDELGLAIADYNLKQFYLPLSMKIFNQLDLFAQEEVIQRSIAAIQYAGTFKDLEYYQTPEFIEFIGVVIQIAILIVTAGASSGFENFIIRILIGFAIGKLSGYALMKIAEEIGDETLRFILAAIVMAVAIYAAGNIGADNSLAINSLEFVLKTTDAAFGAANTMQDHRNKKDAAEDQKRLEETLADNEERIELGKSLGLKFDENGNVIEPELDTATKALLEKIRTESSDDYYNRVFTDLNDILETNIETMYSPTFAYH